MNLLKYTTLFITLAFLQFGCESTDQEKVEELQTNVIDIHDEVMPKLDKIMQLQRSLKVLNSDTTLLLPSDKKLMANNLINNLEKASEGMMNWMRNYDSMMPGMNDEEKLVYLKRQEIAIKQVKQQMLSSISEASEFLKENQIKKKLN